ncbi:probable ADP-ribosylation factor GTPase-activating protein AGD13 [Momordica charantia]|uniref:Probable ADP-ribosylation factor GTPase-activating protein AGD13 n=1 Tax=Momordica charantia TaxID=3673 RepID=A0A6J1CFX9_MOMCH|nr:probable ADP-ribosylation factor GTPase-activating protein AGD13 [Momordica charantia]XP_022140123.1 probable ADP-ribosylation factor GTPase-activating protein AGD13 [Momordica charantia]
MSTFSVDFRRPESAKSRLKDLLLQKDNQLCADCGAPDPKWASANIGVFICLKCSGVHRSLGTHISKVLSVTLDEWSEDEVDAMIEVGGNAYANSIYEAFIPDGYTKPGPSSSHEERLKFIRPKYELQEFLKPSLRIVSNNSTKSSEEPSYFQEIADSFRSSNSSKNISQEGMVEFMGVLKVTVIKGTNLAVRDVKSSDPFIALTIGQQTARTTVIKSNLNPVWNEELMLSVPREYGPLRLQVFDHDVILANDSMGEAEIDLQPLITSATAFGEAEMFENMQIGKWLKSDDNALIDNSAVNIIDGKVIQEVSLKLQNVETGEVYLELEWIPLDQ